MSYRRSAPAEIFMDGVPYTVTVIENPTIEDVLMSEMQVQATEIITPGSIDADHRIERDLRDFLIRLNVER